MPRPVLPSGPSRPLRAAGAAFLIAAAAVGLHPEAAEAQTTLREAMSQAYRDNPTLQARRARLRATDEGVPQALSGWRPRVEVVGSMGRQHQEQNVVPREDTRTTRSVALRITQNIYDGGATEAAVERAEEDVLAERARLHGTEQTVLTDVVSAFMNVVRDQAVLDLNRQNEERLRRQLEATRDRFEVGEVTRTDVAQAESRLSRAVSDRIRAAGNLEVSRADYERVVGRPPDDLVKPGGAVDLPDSRRGSVERAVRDNPDVEATIHARRAALNRIDETFADLLPTVDLVGEAAHQEQMLGPDTERDSLSLTAELSVPIYQQGLESSQIRAAKESAREALDEIEAARRAARDDATSAWETYQASLAEMDAIREEVRAAELALEGVRQEADVGQRTVLDVLDAEQELLDARVSLVEAERALLVAQYNLAAAVGGMTARDLGLDVPYYDPAAYYDRVRDKIWGPGETPESSPYDRAGPEASAEPAGE